MILMCLNLQSIHQPDLHLNPTLRMSTLLTLSISSELKLTMELRPPPPISAISSMNSGPYLLLDISLMLGKMNTIVKGKDT